MGYSSYNVFLSEINLTNGWDSPLDAILFADGLNYLFLFIFILSNIGLDVFNWLVLHQNVYYLCLCDHDIFI